MGINNSFGKCCVCGGDMTKFCNVMNCGKSLCDNCEHTVTKQGDYSIINNHCKKSEQVFKHWSVRSNIYDIYVNPSIQC